ncbi:6,7-dimethyl-8-ribityllumazine synthase [Candidatus Gracilibacteria bacterium 28_42_T64]|nr:6,7-dimethyl-8-ribityllumazine synthase [Candidatus Gracilibacteria bacterium 28_42_T64]
MSEYKLKNEDFSDLDKQSKIVIITSEFNENFTLDLEWENKKFLVENGFENIETYKVPGALEIPGFANKLLSQSNDIALVLCLGVVIKGGTPHFDYVCAESARGIMNISMKYNTPIMNGILTCYTEEQVIERITNTYAMSGLKTLKQYNQL